MQENPDFTIQLPHYSVAIGASAGGLEAIHEFFDNMPSSRNLAFIIIQHLSPHYKSLLVELVGRHTEMKVLEAAHNAIVEKGCVYVIPNNKLLTIRAGKLQLSEKKFEKAPNTAIDTFLKSLAEDQGSKAIAVILSGTGSDGTRGAEAIQAAGGLVLVQDPLSAKFDGMPNSAIAAGYADFILVPELMPEEIFTYTKEEPVQKTGTGRPDEKSLPEVLDLIEEHCGHDFHNYKSPTLLRRITRRMGNLGKKSFSEYLNFLRNDSTECTLLGKDFLIGVTRFFRDEAAFDILRKDILPRIIEKKAPGEVLKIWIVACSTGQEAYSMAIAVNEAVQAAHKALELKIFATDMDADAVEQASKGTYPEAVIAEMEPQLVQKYFTRQDGTITIIPKLRKQIVFARHNILKDPPFIKNDLISCRNMLIYMNNILQRRVFTTLQFGLNLGGYLFLGPSETPTPIKAALDEVNSKWKMYKKVKETVTQPEERFTPGYSLSNNQHGNSKLLNDNARKAALPTNFQEILTEEYGFAAVYIDDSNEIKEGVGDFRRYLSLPENMSSLNILKMVGTDLSVALNTSIRKARAESKKIVLNHMRIREGASEKFINLYVKPVMPDYTIIVFAESREAVLKPTVDFVPQQQHPDAATYIHELEDELQETRINLQMAVESLETTNEELQSSNEELLSSNEELQSSNEELQSLNEELHTLNTEHQLRIRELIELNDDMNNYFRSSQIGQVFVDSELRIRKFNPTAVQMVNLIDSDIGRPIQHISTNIEDNQFLAQIREVIRDQKVTEKEIVLHNKAICLMRILPYMRQDGRSDGVVITFIDITKAKELDNIIKGVFNASLSAIMVFRSIRTKANAIQDFHCVAGNKAAAVFLNQNEERFVCTSLKEELPDLMAHGFFEKFRQVVEQDKLLHTEVSFERDGTLHWYEVLATRMMDGFVVTMSDVTDKKQADEKLRKNYHELIKVKENLKLLNAELEEKVQERTLALTESEERFRLIANAASDVIWDWNLVTNEIWWSDSFFNLFHFDRTETNASNKFRLSRIHPDDRAAVAQSIQTAINGTLEQWSASYRFQKMDGSYAIVSDKGSVIRDEFGTPYRMLGSMMDVTENEMTALELKVRNDELRQLIEEFTFVTDFMPQMVWSTRPDGYHDFYNKGWYNFTGLTYEQTKADGWSLVLHPDDYSRTLPVWKECLQTGKPYDIEYRMRRYDGEYLWFLARALPMRNEEGSIVKWFGTCTDIHDQKIATDVLEQKVIERTQELLESNKDLELSNIELLQFASVASHDLKEPLRKIHIFSNLLKDRYAQQLEGGASDYVDRIIASSARMTRLINDLLSFSRLSVTSFFELTNVNEILNEVLSDLELLIKEKEAVIKADLFPEMEVVPGQLRQVFQNIISNSLKFSRSTVKPFIQITCERVNACRLDAQTDVNGAYCKIVCKDNGIGFDEKYTDKIFTIFQRLHTRDQYEGTGIGLAITKKIVDKHRGLISAQSKEGEGSMFTIIIPMHQSDKHEPMLAGIKAHA